MQLADTDTEVEELLRFVDDLPRGPSGKVQRLKLIDLAG